jgi:hypothetical protein
MPRRAVQPVCLLRSIGGVSLYRRLVALSFILPLHPDSATVDTTLLPYEMRRERKLMQEKGNTNACQQTNAYLQPCDEAYKR